MSSPDQELLEVASGIHGWSRWHEEKQVDFNGFLIVDAGGNVAIDPPEWEPRQFDRAWELGGVAHVVLTSGEHGRKTADLVQRMGAQVHAPKKDVGLIHHFGVDHTFEGGATLPGGLLAIGLRGAKTNGECAFLLPRDGGSLFVGHALIGMPDGKPQMLPDDAFKDVNRTRKGLRALLEPDYERVLLTNGTTPLPGGRDAIEAYLAQHGIRPKRT